MSDDSSVQSIAGKQQFFYGYIIVALSALIMLAITGLHYTYGVFFKPMSAEFGWTRALTSGAFSLSWILQGFLSIAVGRLNDKLGPRMVLTLCGLVTGVGYLLMSQIHNVWHLYIYYGVIIRL